MKRSNTIVVWNPNGTLLELYTPTASEQTCNTGHMNRLPTFSQRLSCLWLLAGANFIPCVHYTTLTQQKPKNTDEARGVNTLHGLSLVVLLASVPWILLLGGEGQQHTVSPQKSTGFRRCVLDIDSPLLDLDFVFNWLSSP